MIHVPAKRADEDESASLNRRFDVVVIGAGFGGLGAALRFAERGADVLLLEARSYPGGCASTFIHDGARFESGATLFSGLASGELFGKWIERYGLGVEIDWIDPLVEFRSPELSLPIGRQRGAFVDSLAAHPSAPRNALVRFFHYQKRVADVMWGLLDDPRLLPPFGVAALASHVRHLPRTACALRDIGKPLSKVLERFGLADFAPLRVLLDALCQITVQCEAREAEAPVALAAIDYFWRGTGHVRGGIGQLASGLVEGLRAAGGKVHFSTRAKRIERAHNGWRIHTRRGIASAIHVAANLLPQDLDALLDSDVPRSQRLPRLAAQTETGWGACMLYLQLEPNDAPAQHLQLVMDSTRPMLEGNHVFCSISGTRDGERAPKGRSTATVSAHVPMSRWRALNNADRGAYAAEVQDRMRATLAARAPEIDARIVKSFTASPRTFERFTARREGLVGGVPRRAGLGQYFQLRNPPVADRLYLVGDSAFPGQSTLATALGGWKVAERHRF